MIKTMALFAISLFMLVACGEAGDAQLEKNASSDTEAVESAGELEIFTGIAVFCSIIGLLVIALLKPLKRLTHGAEDRQIIDPAEQEGFEIAEADKL